MTCESTRRAVERVPNETDEYRIIGALFLSFDASVTVMNVTLGTPGPPEYPDSVIVAPAGRWDRTNGRTGHVYPREHECLVQIPQRRAADDGWWLAQDLDH